MPQYDGSIRIGTEITTREAEKELKSLKSSITKTANEIASLRSKMDALKDVKTPTQEYKKLQKELDSTIAKYTELDNRINDFKKIGMDTKSDAFRKTQDEAQELYMKIEDIRGAMFDLEESGKSFTLGSDTDKYAQMSAQMQQLNQQMQSDTQRQTELQSSLTAEEQRLAEIKANATEADQEIIDLLERRKQLLQEIADLEKAGVGLGYEEYDSANQELAEINDKIRAYKDNVLKIPERFSKMKDSVCKAFSAIISGISKTGNIFSFFKNSANKAFSSLSKGAKKSSGLFSTFTSRLKGIALSLLILNWISKGFNAMISGMKTGFQNFMGYSSDFANSVQSMKNAMSTLGNQFAAAFSPIVQMVIPWLTQLVNAISAAMNYVAQFIAVLGGKSTFTRAKQVQDSYNKSLGGTASAAKKAYGALAKFDDLDVLQKKEDTGAGGGADAAGDMFEEVPVDSRFTDLVKWFKDMWENSDFYELGKILGERLKKALESIPWNEIKAAARKVGKSLASLINGFIEVKDLGYLIGRTLSEAMNTAFEFLNAFVHELHWSSIGRFIAEELNGFFESIDWELIRDTFVTGFKGLADSINSFIKNFNWDNISDTISNAINTIAETVYTFFATVDWGKLGKELGEQLREAIEKIDWEEIGRALGSIVQSALDFLVSFVRELDFGETVHAFFDTMKGFFSEADAGDLTEIILTVIASKLAVKALTFGFGEVASAIFGGIEASTTAAGVMTSTAEAASGLSFALEGLAGAFGFFSTTVLAAGAASLLIDAHLDELGEAAGANQQQIDTLTDRYSGLTGKLNIVKDAFSVVGNAMDGFGFNASNTAGQIGALEAVMDSISEGTIYTDAQLEKLQERFGLTDEDIEMLRQSMLDANEPLRQLADNFGLFDASVETLQDVQEGMKLIEDGTISASEAFNEFSKPMWDMNDAALSFFQSVSDGTITLDNYQAKIGETSETVSEFATSMGEAGENIADGVTKGFEKADVQSPVQCFFDKVKEAFASIFDMHSPAKNMEPDGENILLGILEGFKNKFNEFGNAVLELYQTIQTFFTSGNAQSIGEEMGNGILLGFRAKLQEYFTTAWTAIYESTVESWTLLQEYFTEFWTLFIEHLTETWEEILLLFTEKWEEIQLLFENFIIFLNEIFIVSWIEMWTLAGQNYQTFHDLLVTLTNAIQDMLTLFLKAVETLIKITWKNAWNNAKNIFEEFKVKAQEISDAVREIVQSLFDFVMGLVAEMLAAIESVGSAAANISFSGGSSGGGGGASFAMPRALTYSLSDIPHLASGSVIRGGNPFMAILGDQRVGQTNVEAPANLIKDMAREGIREELANMNFGMGQSKVVLNINGIDVGEAVLDDWFSVMERRGYDVSVLGVT